MRIECTMVMYDRGSVVNCSACTSGMIRWVSTSTQESDTACSLYRYTGSPGVAPSPDLWLPSPQPYRFYPPPPPLPPVSLINVLLVLSPGCPCTLPCRTPVATAWRQGMVVVAADSSSSSSLLTCKVSQTTVRTVCLSPSPPPSLLGGSTGPNPNASMDVLQKRQPTFCILLFHIKTSKWY